MKLSENNISKFERIIEEEWSLLREAGPPTKPGAEVKMAGPGGSMPISGPKTTRFQSAVGGSQSIKPGQEHAFFNWLKTEDPYLYHQMDIDFGSDWNSENRPADPGEPGSSTRHKAMWNLWQRQNDIFLATGKSPYGGSDTARQASMQLRFNKALNKAVKTMVHMQYPGDKLVFDKPGSIGRVEKGLSAAEIEQAKILDDALTPEPNGKISQARSIINTSAKESEEWFKFIDDEKSAFKLVKQFSSTIRDYYWLNLRICEATGYNSIIEFLISFSGRRTGFGSDVPLETWVRTLAYQENMDYALVEIEEEDWNDFRKHLEKLQDSNPEVWNLAYYPTKWSSLGMKPYTPLRDHIGLITGKQDKLIADRKAIAEKKKEAVRLGKQNSFIVTQWARDYLDENPAEALQFGAGIVSMGSGLLAWSIATALSATGVAINVDNKEYGEAGNNAFWTAFFALGAIKNIPSVRRLTNAGKLKIIEGFTTSRWGVLNQIESKAFADITKYVNSPGGQAAVARITSRRAAVAYSRSTTAAKMSGPGRALNNIINGGKNSFGRLLGFIDNTKYITVPGILGWNWYANWWPEIYYNTPAFVDAEDVKIYEDLEDDGDVMFDPVFDEQGTYVGPDPNEYN